MKRFLFLILIFWGYISIICGVEMRYKLYLSDVEEYVRAKNSSYNLKMDTCTKNCISNEMIISFKKKINLPVNDIISVSCENKESYYNIYIFKISDYNSEELWLYNVNNKTYLRILSNVIFSLNGFILSYDVPSSDKYEGVEIYKIKDGGYEQILKLKNKEWFPVRIYWLDTENVIIKARYFENSLDNEVYYRLHFFK